MPTISEQIELNQKVASVDKYYGPYTSVAAANTAIPSTSRTKGRKIGIYENGNAADYSDFNPANHIPGDDVIEYTYQGGIADINLVPIVTGSGGGGGSAGFVVDPAGLPVNSNTTSYLTSNYGSESIGFKVFDTTNKFVYTKIATSTWVKSAAVNPDDDMDPAGVIQGVNLISYK